MTSTLLQAKLGSVTSL